MTNHANTSPCIPPTTSLDWLKGRSESHWENSYRYSTQIQSLFESYRDKEYLVLAVTLSTYVKTRSVAESPAFEMLWTRDFLSRVQRRIPRKALAGSFVETFNIECSPEGNWHFHGLLAVAPEHAERIWSNGKLSRQLERDLLTFRKRGDYRACRVNSFLIEPVKSIEDWVRYINKPWQQKINY